MKFVGEAIALEQEDIATVAHDFGIEEAALMAVIKVESSGKGFDKIGRPKALFERHHFYKHLKANADKQYEAVTAGLAYPKWGEKPYPKGSDAVYDEIMRACEIDEHAALLSTSWGLGQIMGSNHAMAGCESVEYMVESAMHSEHNQLVQMVKFIEAAGLINKLKFRDWAGFSKGYNGPAYETNRYDKKLEEAYTEFA